MQTAQFSLRQVLLAMTWIAVGLALWRLTSPFNWHGFRDDDPDNIWPRIELSFYVVPIAGAIGSLRGRAISTAAKATMGWLLASIVIFAIGLARLF